MKKLFLLLGAVFALVSAEAQTPTLIKDINTKGLGNTSSFAGQVRSTLLVRVY